jgi:hypothetical protein
MTEIEYYVNNIIDFYVDQDKKNVLK